MINVLDLLYSPITSKSVSIPDDMSGEPQNDALTDNLWKDKVENNFIL
jgi:hypothetical protein